MLHVFSTNRIKRVTRTQLADTVTLLHLYITPLTLSKSTERMISWESNAHLDGIILLGKPRATPRPVRNMELNNWWVQTFHCIELLNCINWSSVFQIMAYWILRNKSSEFQFMSQSNVGSGESKLHERSFRIAQQNRLFSLFGSTTSGSWKRTAVVSP